MEIRGKLTESEAMAARQLILTRLERITRYGLGELLACMTIFIGLSLAYQNHSFRSIFIALVLCCLGVAWWYVAHRRLIESDMKKLIAALPLSYTLASSGIEADFENGIRILGPWSTISWWRESGTFIFLGVSGDHLPQIVLPIADLAKQEHEALIEVLAKNLYAHSA